MARIWHILGGSSLGGGTYVVRKLAEALLAEGHTVTVLTSHPETGSLFRSLGCRVVEDIHFHRAIRPASDLAGALRLAARLRREGCDLLHTHTSKGGVVGRVAGRLARVPRIVHHVHGFAFEPAFTPPPRLRFYAAMERAVAPLCDAMVFVNSTDLALARDLRIVRPGQSVQVVCNGVDLAADRPAAPCPGDSRVSVVFLGRLADQKGVDILLQAAAAITTAIPWELLILGDGPERVRLETQAALLPAGLCRFLGHRQDAAEFLASADIVALPSRWEGHSIAVLEAMAHGRPVLTTAIKGNLQTIQSGVDGLLVAPGDPAAFAAGLQILIENPELRRRLGDAARRTVARRFLARDMVRGVLDIYASLGLAPASRGVLCA
jgi:glycosyltransferase involved in cell wall biosynthesis